MWERLIIAVLLCVFGIVFGAFLFNNVSGWKFGLVMLIMVLGGLWVVVKADRQVGGRKGEKNEL